MLVRFLTIVALTLAATPALAHVTLEQREAAVGTRYKAIFRLSHGCSKSATVRLSVKIPEGVISVKPMAKPGWKIEIMRGSYEKTYSFLHGAKLTEGPKEIVWSGGNLPDAFYDEFVVSTFLAGDLPSGNMLYFPVVQTCEEGEHRWVEVPSSGRHDEHLNEPAPGVKLLPNQKGH